MFPTRKGKNYKPCEFSHQQEKQRARHPLIGCKHTESYRYDVQKMKERNQLSMSFTYKAKSYKPVPQKLSTIGWEKNTGKITYNNPKKTRTTYNGGKKTEKRGESLLCRGESGVLSQGNPSGKSPIC